jgi:hypothetical protein
MRKAVVEVKCSRCERTEYRAALEASTEDANSLEIKLVVENKVVVNTKFGDLCTPCTETCKKYLDLITKKIEGVSPIRGAKKKEPAKVVGTKETPMKGAPSALSK